MLLTRVLKCPRQTPNLRSVCVLFGRSIRVGQSLPQRNQAHANFTSQSKHIVTKRNGTFPPPPASPTHEISTYWKLVAAWALTAPSLPKRVPITPASI